MGKKIPDVSPDIGHAVRAYRIARGIEQEELANKIGYTQGYISKIENGAINPSLKALKKIAKALGLEAEGFFSPTKVISLDDEKLFSHLPKKLRQFAAKDDSPPYIQFAHDLYEEGFTEEELRALKLITMSRKKKKNGN